MKILNWLKKEFLQIVLLVLPFALAAAWWNRFPATVVTHWGFDGQPNGWMPKGPGLLGVPLLNVALCALLAFLPSIDPRMRRNPASDVARYRRVLRVCRYAITAFMALVAVAIMAAAAGWQVNMGRLACNGVLVLLAVIGNFMGNLQPNYLAGIRTPWTLKDADTWRAVHRLGGRIMVFGSVALLAAGLFVPAAVQGGLLIAFGVGLGVWSLGYSAWYFHKRRAA